MEQKIRERIKHYEIWINENKINTETLKNYQKIFEQKNDPYTALSHQREWQIQEDKNERYEDAIKDLELMLELAQAT